MDTDFWLIQKMKSGDEKAFDVFVRRYYEEILKYCCYHCQDRTCAEDMTQETFLRFFAKLSGYRHTGRTKNYLYTIAGNLCRDYHRRRKEYFLEEQQLEERGLEEQSSPGQPETEKVLERISLENAINSLPEELREVIVLHYFHDLKYAEIAGILQIGLPLVKYRIRQAKMKLEKLCEEV